MYVKLLFWHDYQNRMANLMIAAELHLFRLGISLSQLDCHSQWSVKFIDLIQFTITVTYSCSVANSTTRNWNSLIIIWYRLILVVSPLVFRLVMTLSFMQDLMLIARRIRLLNMVLNELLAREKIMTTVHYLGHANQIKCKYKWLN